MRVAIAILFALISTNGYASCGIPLGTYEAMVESEYSLKIQLLDKNVAYFIHKNWEPGYRDMFSGEHIYKGQWRCEGKKISLDFTIESIEGVYKQNIYEFSKPPKNFMTLDFQNYENKKSLIGGWIFWPEGYSK